MLKIILTVIIISLQLHAALTFAALRDPTEPPASFTMQEIPSSSMLILHAIIVNKEQSLAVINESTVKVGDEIFGHRVIAIDKTTVQLEGPSGKLTLFLFGQPIKRLLQIECKREWNVCMDAKR